MKDDINLLPDNGREEKVHTINKILLRREANEEFFDELGLRHYGKLQFHPNSTCHGYFIIVLVIILAVLYFYAAILSKILPPTGIASLDCIKNDVYFCYLAPLILLPTVFMIYVNWLSFEHYRQN
mmetsp:Transcript_4747/g.7073  ORF Transcript_4747/g.7073 Transcript_4747/m.7073 type:complete len:125 (+) Transcript_4747:1-375(+)